MGCVKEFNDIKSIIDAHAQLMAFLSPEETRSNTIKDIKKLADQAGNIPDEQIAELVDFFNGIYPSDKITSTQLLGWLGKIKIEETGEPKMDSPMDSEENYEDRSLPKINFIEDVYGGSSAKTSMLTLFNSEVIKSIIVDIDRELEILGDTLTLNTNILDMQNRLYAKILDYIKTLGVEHSLPENLYDELVDNESQGLQRLDDFFRNQVGEARLFFNFRIDINTLSNWRRKAAVGEEEFIKKRDAYNAYFILKNFDKLITNQYGLFIKFLESDAGKLLSKKDKYEFDYSADVNKVTTWQLEDLLGKGAYDLIPKHLQRFIESCEIVDSNNERTNKFLTLNHITYFVSKIKKDFRSLAYNSKHIVIATNAKKSVVDIKNKLDFSSGKGYLKGKESQISEELKEQLALMLYDQEPDLLGRRVLYLEDVVNNIRDHANPTLKALFDLRNLMDHKFTNDVEERIFKNLYRYLFADRYSLYSSSLRIYNELATLFDTTSMVDLMQYKIDVDGNISVSTLSPEMIDLNLNTLKRRINSQFSTGNIDYLLDRYEVKINDTGDLKSVQFVVKDYAGRRWEFTFGANQLQSWSMTRPYEGDETKRETFNQATTKLTERDLSVLSSFIKDVLLIDIESDPELKTAILAQYKNRNGTINLHETIYLLLDMAVTIFSNAAFFRRTDLTGVKYTPVEELLTEKLYTTKEYKEGRLIKGAIYTTADDAPVDYDELNGMFGTTSVRFKTKAEVEEMKQRGVLFGIEDVVSYRNIIENWLGDEEALRPNATYQSVDIISAKLSKKLEKIAKALALLDGSTFKSQVRTAERTNITIGQSSMLFAERFTRLGKYARAADHPMTVLWNNLKHAVKESNMLREAATPAGVKQNKDFNFKENFYSCFVIDFLLPLYAHRNWKVKFTESVNSDKPNVPKIIIDKLEEILTAPDAKSKIKEVLNDTYRQCFNNIESDFSELTEFFNTTLRKENQAPIKITLENNFLEFNDWCEANNVSPVAMLAKITLEYNLKHRTNPIAIAENIHYHTNFQSGKLEINFSFLDALAKYTVISDSEYEQRLEVLNDRIRTTSNLKEKKYLNSIKLQLIDDYKNGWRDKIKGIINSENTRAQLTRNGSDIDYLTFKNQYLQTVIVSTPTNTVVPNRLNTDAFVLESLTPVTTEVFKYTAYDDFIEMSNLHFLHKLLKNDVSLDLLLLESKTQITKFTDGIVDQIPELQAEFQEMMQRDPASEKTHRNVLKKKFTHEWFTPSWDRMAFGILQVEAAPGKWVNLSSRFVEDMDIEDLSKTTEAWLDYPILLSTYSDLSLLHMKVNGKRVDYTDPDFDISSKELYYTDDKGLEIKVRVKINPILEQYNLNSHYWTTLSTFATTGSHIWSDPKKAANTLQEECFKWFDNNKRNVINSATKLLFRLGDVWGITKMANVAVVDDIIAECTDILGDIPTVKPYDGATFVNPFMHYWENYSLNNQITGFTKKPIHEFYDERLMAGGLHKTASFAITNNTMRNSLNSLRMMWKMSSGIWVDENGNALPVDLTLGLDIVTDGDQPTLDLVGQNCIGLTLVEYKVGNEQKRHRGPMYFLNTKRGRVVKEIVEFKSLGNNQYRISTKTIDQSNPDHYVKKEGTMEDEIHSDIVTINSNYTFWKALGGYDSALYNIGLKRFEYSEYSIKTVADWAAKVRFRYDKDGNLVLQKYSLTNVPENATAEDKLFSAFAEQIRGKKFTNASDSSRDRDTRLNYCPLKHSDIHYLVTRGATKKYAANINSRDAYMNDKPLNFFKIRMSEAGIQLDPTHEADQSVVSMMTQVISALAERGYTAELAQEVYEALSELTSLAIADDMAAFEKYFKSGDRRLLQHVVSKLIVEEFMDNKTSTRDANIARAITERLIAEGKRGEVLLIKDTLGIYPFSDPSMYSLLLNTITSAMNKKAIRAKMFGSMSVLNPSHELFKMIGNRMLSEFTSFNEIAALQSNLDKNQIAIQQAEIGRTYRVNGGAYDGQIFTLHNSDFYYAWKYRLAGLNVTVSEVIYSYDLPIEGTKEQIAKYILDNNGQFNFYRFKTADGTIFTKRIGDVSELQDNIIEAQKVNLYGRNLAARNFFYEDATLKRGNRYDLAPVQESRYSQIYDIVKKELSSLYKDNNLATISDALTHLGIQDQTLRDFYRHAYKEVSAGRIQLVPKLLRQKELQRNLLAIKNYGNVQIYDGNNLKRTIKVKKYNTKSFEAILPMVYAEQFGLRLGDTIANIIMDSDFFTERILENYLEENRPEFKHYDLCIKRANGKHLYIKYVGGDEQFDFEGFDRLNISKYADDDGIFRMDPRKANKKIYPLASKDDLVYYDRNSKEEVILTKDLSFYIKELKFTDLNISKNVSEQTKKVITEALENNKKNIVCNYLLQQIGEIGYDLLIENLELFVESVEKFAKSPRRLNKEERKQLLDNLRELSPNFMDKIEALSKKQRVSFFQSLNFTVARIPAQGMQSFMAMEIVGFNDTGVNDCYVSAEQIRLLGSDYDVDKATFMGFAYDKTGLFVKWSPFFKMYSTADLEASMKYLPYPNGRVAVKEKHESLNSIDFKKYKSLFEPKVVNAKNNFEEIEESENDDVSTEAKGEEKTIYVLKKNRSQALLGSLLRDINAVAREQIKQNIYTTSFTLYFTEEVPEELVDAIILTANKQNTYINKVEKEEKENLLKNFVSYKVLSIALNPANALAGETTVDESAKPWKKLGNNSVMGARPLDSRPGDSSILWSALQQNHTGKNVIAIAAAAGLKCFHAITLMFNQAIHNKSNLSDLWFDVNIENPLVADGKTEYHFVADPFLDIDEIYNPELTAELVLEIKDTFIKNMRNQGLSENLAKYLLNTYLEHSEWAGSNDSGILTLATDNAKELMLDRLNAGEDLASLYLYGISIGMKGEDIFKIMTSPTARVLARISKGNIFTSEYLNESISKAIDFISRENPRTPTFGDKYLSAAVSISAEKTVELDNVFSANGLAIEGLEITHDLDKLKEVHDKIGLLMRYKKADGEQMSIRDSVIKASRDGNILKYIKRLHLIKNRVLYNARQAKKNDGKTHKFGYSYEEQEAKRLIDNLITYVVSIHEIVDAHSKIDPEFKGNIWADLHNIETLNEGLKENSILVRLLSLNQGAKTKTTDKYKFYEDFATIIAGRLKKAKLEDQDKIIEFLGKDARIDLEKFMKDLDYQKELIKLYDTVKHTYNPLRVVLNVPHFASYLRAAISDYNKTRGVSLKFRTMVDTIVPYIHNEMGIRSSKETPIFYKKGEDFISNILTNRFLVEQLEIKIPAGNRIFFKTTDAHGNEVLDSRICAEETSIELGTIEGNETFRVWMNNEVIPRLHDLGQAWAPGVTPKLRIKVNGTEASGVNTFLKDLTPNITNQTFDKNNIKIFALPIDMIPKSDTERDKLARYTADFIDLRNYKYAISDSLGYNILDLFFYYNLINFKNLGGPSSLTPLFEPLVYESDSIISRYLSFISYMDTNYVLTEGIDYTREMLELALAPTSREMSAVKANNNKIPYFRNLNRDTLKFELLKRDRNMAREAMEEQLSIGYLGRNNYFADGTFKGTSIAPEYHQVYQLKKNEIETIEVGNVIAQFSAEFENGVPKTLKITNIKFKLPESEGGTEGSVSMEDLIITDTDQRKQLLLLIKVRNTQGAYEFNINPVSLLIYLSSLRPC